MNKFSQLLRNFHFWGIVIVFLVCTILHYPKQLPFFGELEINSFLGLERHAIERILFLIPIIYATFTFGRNGGIISLVVACGLMLPRVFFLSPYPKDSLFETCTALAMGGFISWWFESRRREIGRREQAVLKLEAARRQLQSYVERIKEDEKRLRKYADEISQAHEEERKRIARELHDDTIQTMVAISRRLDTFISENPSIAAKILNPLEALQKDINESLIRMRRFVQDLRPPTLEYLGLLPALRELATQVYEQSGIKIDVKVVGADRHFSAEESLLIYRIIQEAVRNVWKHSEATKAEIDAGFHKDKLVISVRDNGNGFESKASSELLDSGRLGLMGMEERAHLLGGTVNVVSKRGKGTTVTLEIPNRK